MATTLLLGSASAGAARAVGDSGQSASATPRRGGVFRTAVPYMPFTDQLDPTGEYANAGWGLLSQLLVRTLVTYRHVAGPAGEEVVPDLATDLGAVSPDGLTYTFHLKEGLRFGPPLERAITSGDIAYAFARMATSRVGAEYAFYFQGVIAGFHLHRGGTRPISGIATPNSRTITFTLSQPTGDFLQRLTLPATGPVPRSVAGCFTGPGGYGRDIVSSGPYMIAGAPLVDASSCSTIRPMRGFDPARHLVLVRNPTYNPATDSPAVRSIFLDGVRIEVDPSVTDIFKRIRSGELDGSLGSFAVVVPTDVISTYLHHARLRPLLHSDAMDALYYVEMNLLVRPFDDVHVRRAVNLALDKRAIRARLGPATTDVATGVIPPGILPRAAGYDPYATPGNRGSVAAARAAMAGSRYDFDRDGRCDIRACRNVLFLVRNTPPWPRIASSIVQRLRAIGIHLEVKEVSPAVGYTLMAEVHRLIPISAVPGWLKDYSDPYTMVHFPLTSAGIQCYGQENYSEVGMTRAQAKDCGVLRAWARARPPSVDGLVSRCVGLSGPARSRCWFRVDRALMRRVVPWVPYRWPRSVSIMSPAVSHYEFDAFSSVVSLCHLALAGQ